MKHQIELLKKESVTRARKPKGKTKSCKQTNRRAKDVGKSSDSDTEVSVPRPRKPKPLKKSKCLSSDSEPEIVVRRSKSHKKRKKDRKPPKTSDSETEVVLTRTPAPATIQQPKSLTRFQTKVDFAPENPPSSQSYLPQQFEQCPRQGYSKGLRTGNWAAHLYPTINDEVELTSPHLYPAVNDEELWALRRKNKILQSILYKRRFAELEDSYKKRLQDYEDSMMMD